MEKETEEKSPSFTYGVIFVCRKFICVNINTKGNRCARAFYCSDYILYEKKNEKLASFSKRVTRDSGNYFWEDTLLPYLLLMIPTVLEA